VLEESRVWLNRTFRTGFSDKKNETSLKSNFLMKKLAVTTKITTIYNTHTLTHHKRKKPLNARFALISADIGDIHIHILTPRQ
jgi:hypothetical protein